MGLTVGLTGGIASGKSTVASILRDIGCTVFDADELVRELYRPGAAGHKKLVEHYGEGILTPNGEIDRPKLSRIALASDDGARELNQLIHPLVIERQKELIDAAFRADEDAIVVVEATLLIESGGRERFDKIVVVDVSPDLQRERAIRRGLPEEDVDRRISRQMDRSERLRHADYVIVNDGDERHLRGQVETVVKRMRKAN